MISNVGSNSNSALVNRLDCDGLKVAMLKSRSLLVRLVVEYGTLPSLAIKEAVQNAEGNLPEIDTGPSERSI